MARPPPPGPVRPGPLGSDRLPGGLLCPHLRPKNAGTGARVCAGESHQLRPCAWPATSVSAFVHKALRSFETGKGNHEYEAAEDCLVRMHQKGRGLRGGPRGGQTGGWRRLPKRLRGSYCQL